MVRRCCHPRSRNSTLDLVTVLSTIVTKAMQLSNTDAAVIWVLDELNQTLRVRAPYGFSEQLVAAIRDQPAATGSFRRGRRRAGLRCGTQPA
jgi:hypothetical protein